MSFKHRPAGFAVPFAARGGMLLVGFFAQLAHVEAEVPTAYQAVAERVPSSLIVRSQTQDTLVAGAGVSTNATAAEQPAQGMASTGSASADTGASAGTGLSAVANRALHTPAPGLPAWAAASLLGALLLAATLPILVRDGIVPFLSTIAYVVSLVVVKIMVKDAMKSGYHYPYTITSFHMLLTACVAAALDPPNLREAFRVFPISVVVALSLGLNNTALVFGSAAFVTMVGACAPAITYFLELSGRRREDQPHNIWRTVAVLVVCAGTACCIEGELAYSSLAVILAMLANFGRSFKTVWQSALLEVAVPPCRIVAWTGLWGFALMLPIALRQEGFGAFHHFGEVSTYCKLMVIGSGAAACSLNLLQVFAVKTLGPTMQNVVASLQIVMILVLATVWLQETVTFLQWAGALLIVTGCASANLCKAKAKASMSRNIEHPASEVGQTCRGRCAGDVDCQLPRYGSVLPGGKVR